MASMDAMPSARALSAVEEIMSMMTQNRVALRSTFEAMARIELSIENLKLLAETNAARRAAAMKGVSKRLDESPESFKERKESLKVDQLEEKKMEVIVHRREMERLLSEHSLLRAGLAISSKQHLIYIEDIVACQDVEAQIGGYARQFSEVIATFTSPYASPLLGKRKRVA